VSDPTNNAPAALPAYAAVRGRMPITPERAEAFLIALRETGSYSAAAAAASPHLAAKGSKSCSIGAFREYARRNPQFAENVEAAMTEVKGRMEALVLERAMTPDERPIFGKNGALLGVQKDSRPANQMLALWLASHDPGKWAAKQSIKSEVTVNNADGSLTGGQAYIVKPADVLLLDEADRVKLIDLLSKLEDRREEANAPATIETKPYTMGWGPNAAPSRLPAPADDAYTDPDANAAPLGDGATDE
jgi:hypothetical protein